MNLEERNCPGILKWVWKFCVFFFDYPYFQDQEDRRLKSVFHLEEARNQHGRHLMALIFSQTKRLMISFTIIRSVTCNMDTPQPRIQYCSMSCKDYGAPVSSVKNMHLRTQQKVGVSNNHEKYLNRPPRYIHKYMMYIVIVHRLTV